MDEFESIDDESPDRYSPSRRSVLKAVGATAVAGGVLPAAVSAQEEEVDAQRKPDNCTDDAAACTAGTGETMCACARPSCQFLAKVDIAGSGSVTVPAEQVPADFDAVAIKASTCCYTASYNENSDGSVTVTFAGKDISNVSFFKCGNGGNGRVVFYGCSQVCTDNPNGVELEVVGHEGEIEWVASNRNDPQARTLGSPVYCFETKTGAILSAGGQPNTNENCGGQNAGGQNQP